jgi:hypothetical protein
MAAMNAMQPAVQGQQMQQVLAMLGMGPTSG